MSKMLDTNELRVQYTAFKVDYRGEIGKNWRSNYSAMVRRVQTTSEAEWCTPEFQRVLWEHPGVSGIGPGSSVTVTGAYEDMDLARFLLGLRDRGAPGEPEAAALVLQAAYDEILARVRPRYTDKRPRARIVRLMAALYPHQMTCLMDDRRTLQLRGLIRAAKAPTAWVGQNAPIRSRLREILEGLEGSDVDHAMFSWFLWETHFTTNEDKDKEIVPIPEARDAPHFVLLPAHAQRRGLPVVQNNVSLLVAIVRECEQGINRDDLIGVIRQEAPHLQASSAGVVINQAMLGSLGLIRYSDRAYLPTERGSEMINAPDPAAILRGPLVGRVFGMGHLLLSLQKQPGQSQIDAANYVQSVVPTWKTSQAASFIVQWARIAGLVRAVKQDGRLRLFLTDDGDEYAAALPEDFLQRWTIDDPVVSDDDLDEASSVSGTLKTLGAYSVSDIIADGCFLPEAEIEAMLALLRHKKNLVLQGPPGTGKTWLARRLGYALAGARDPERVMAVQFQPSLSYEDFVRGWRPYAGEDGKGGLRLADGAFLECVSKALERPDEDFVLVIEEINRGNPAQILGELLTLLEADKRVPEEALRLAYPRDPEERVHIPPNLHVIGTMNLADRSLALVDLALRRRFAFRTLAPTLNGAWRSWCAAAGAPGGLIDAMATRLGELNEAIAQDNRLRSQFCVGHSFVTPPKGGVADWAGWFRALVETEIAPLLDEYWYDDEPTARSWKARLAAPL